VTRLQEFQELFRRPGFVWVNIGNVLDGICYFGIVPLLTGYLQSRFGLGDQPVGWIFSMYVGAVTLMMFPGGALCDRLGARRAMQLSLLILGLGRSGLALASEGPSGLPLAVLSLVVMAFGTGIMQPTVYAGVKEYTRSEQSAMGYAWLYALMNLGSVVWMLLSPEVREHAGGTHGVYALLAALTWVNLALQCGFFREPGNRVVRDPGAATTSLLWQGRFLFFIVMLMPVRNLVAHLNVTFPTYFRRVHPAYEPHLEWCFALNYALLFLGTPLLTRATAKWPVLSVIIVGSILSALSLGFLALPSALVWVVCFLLVFSVGEALWQARFYQYVADQAPPGQLGAAMSLANFPWFVAKTTAGMYSGWMLTRFVPASGTLQPAPLWLTYGAVALVTPLALWGARKWLQPKTTGE
jgi:proton-dependent oligopeptide transporter, POT family